MTQTTIYEYPVRRSFSYDGEDYEPGDMWTPGGFKNDKNIIEFFVIKERAQIVTAPTKKSARRKSAAKKD